MVHALDESWRVLQPNGMLIDLRPIASDPALEILLGDGAQSAGNIDEARGRVDDDAADAAIAQAVERELFKQEGADQFRFSMYWSSLEEFQAYAADSWSDSTEIPSKVVGQAEALIKTASGPIKVRVKLKMHLRTYRRSEAMVRSPQSLSSAH